ncbi:MAG TPA: flagellar hook-associated protein FlgK [Sulfuricurvum sp.]|nr:MAG: flagellar hook-associated protein FlgK [Campylobacterales bacterium 16-40-21]OZA02385.1 MAG: flagellar hook-associated protein FlgK [Sulfuricurvum sp. 17-40-25]HQS67621.1 flagellar hook-associated protein FlgK [Sulfuricurvum sp.]HQT37023.1 flagellar hook-associated protein FlgK [Sulfuricurvum sp.]
MASIFNALHIGYSGLNAAQIGIDTTGHNIANAETEGYSRQRVVTSTSTPISITPGSRGSGVQITEIVRIFDSFVYNRYSAAAQNKEYSDTLKKNLEELSTYFPDIDNVGIKEDLKNYFDLWQSLASNPSNTAVKVALAQQTQTLTQHISQTQAQIGALQRSTDDQILVNVEEVNRIGGQIADLNKAIDVAESDGVSNANDLRDQREMLAMSLGKLIGAKVFSGRLETNMPVDTNIATKSGSYTIQVGGFNIVDGSYFHPIGVDATSNSGQFNDIYYERQDGVRFPFADQIKGGKVGALIELRGSLIGNDGKFSDGFLQQSSNTFDVFSKGLIEATNNLYAQTATKTMQSNALSFSDNQALLSTDENFKAGTFNLIAYDINGNEVARRSVTINESTVMDNASATNFLSDGVTKNSIAEQLKAQKDDTGDNNALNDIDDMITATFAKPSNVFTLSMNATYAASGFTFAIEDQGTNFAGVTGLNRFFDGNSAKNIELSAPLQKDPSLIRGYKAPVSGDNQMALDMVQLQFTRFDFKERNNQITSDTMYGFFDQMVTRIGSKTNAVIASNDTITSQFNAIKQEYDSISKVSIDEEMANLIRYQTSYGAAAKVITTIDQMMTTLLGLKQ